MILTFHIPPEEGRGYVISIVYSPEKYQRIGKWEIFAIC